MDLTKEKLDYIKDKLTFEFPYSIEEYLENPTMENYHYHSSFSNISTTDSPTGNESYAKTLKEYGYNCIFSGEHGSQGNVHEVYLLAEKYGLKYRHSTEAYWVKNRLEKDSTNCHINLIATCDEGRKDINFALSMANIDGYYYKPRIDLELLLNIPKDNIIVTSACIAGWKYQDADDIWIKLFKHFGNNFFLEVQNHNTDKQKKLNQHILELSHKYGIQIICGLDSHYINAELENIKRDKLIEYKKMNYPDEEGWYLDFPNFEETYRRFEEQGVLSEEEIFTSMINTLVFNSNRINEIVFDRKFKIPCVYKDKTYDERCKIYKDMLYKEYNEHELDKRQDRMDGIKYETKQVIESGVVDYFLTNKKILTEALNNQGGVLTTSSRGSMSSYYTNKLLGFTTLDRFNAEVPIYPERFLTKDRVLAGQMPDMDLNIVEQEPFLKASRNIIGEQSCYPLMAIEKIKEKNAWQIYASVNGVEPQVANYVSKCIDSYNETIKYIDNEEDKKSANIEKFIPKEYIDIYEKSKEYQGIVIGLKVHACGHILFDGDVRREFGLISAISETTKKRTLCACVEGKYLDTFGYVKNDYLIVDSVGLINECWKSIGQKVPTINELRDLISNDKPTWDIYENGITCCINQMEKDSTTKKCMRYKPKTLGELSALICAIRPGFVSLIDTFLDRKPYTTGENQIDELLKDSSHFAIYQEGIMKILGYLGLEMSETYGVIKSISKKKFKDHPEKLKELKDKLKQGWIDKIGNDRNFNNIWQVIEDASRYSFNSPHGLSMGADSAYLAWFKAHHTAKFYEVAINHYQAKNNKDKINALTNEIIKFYGYKIGDYKFGDDNRKVIINENTKIIYPNMGKIKGLQKIAPDILYEMSLNKNSYQELFFVFQDLINSELNNSSIDKIIKLNYFSEYGDINYILQQLEIYKEINNIINKFSDCKQLKKEYINSIGLNIDDIKKCCNSETEKMLKGIDNQKLVSVITDNYNYIKEKLSKKYIYIPTTMCELIHYQLLILGKSDKIDETSEYYGVESIDKNKYNTPFITLYKISDGTSIQYKCDKKWFEENQVEQGDIIEAVIRNKKKKKYIGIDDKGKPIYEDLEEKEDYIKLYNVVITEPKK